MSYVLFHLTSIAVVAVLIVLGFGLRAMMKGDSPNLSQKLMRWRVLLQFVAVMIIMLAAYLQR